MSQANGMEKTVGRLASLSAVVGVAVFMAGLFGAPRSFVFIGVGLITLGLIGFFVEELGVRSRSLTSRSMR